MDLPDTGKYPEIRDSINSAMEKNEIDNFIECLPSISGFLEEIMAYNTLVEPYANETDDFINNLYNIFDFALKLQNFTTDQSPILEQFLKVSVLFSRYTILTQKQNLKILFPCLLGALEMPPIYQSNRGEYLYQNIIEYCVEQNIISDLIRILNEKQDYESYTSVICASAKLEPLLGMQFNDYIQALISNFGEFLLNMSDVQYQSLGFKFIVESLKPVFRIIVQCFNRIDNDILISYFNYLSRLFMSDIFDFKNIAVSLLSFCASQNNAEFNRFMGSQLENHQVLETFFNSDFHNETVKLFIPLIDSFAKQTAFIREMYINSAWEKFINSKEFESNMYLDLFVSCLRGSLNFSSEPDRFVCNYIDDVILRIENEKLKIQTLIKIAEYFSNGQNFLGIENSYHNNSRNINRRNDNDDYDDDFNSSDDDNNSYHYERLNTIPEKCFIILFSFFDDESLVDYTKDEMEKIIKNTNNDTKECCARYLKQKINQCSYNAALLDLVIILSENSSNQILSPHELHQGIINSLESEDSASIESAINFYFKIVKKYNIIPSLSEFQTIYQKLYEKSLLDSFWELCNNFFCGFGLRFCRNENILDFLSEVIQTLPFQENPSLLTKKFAEFFISFFNYYNFNENNIYDYSPESYVFLPRNFFFYEFPEQMIQFICSLISIDNENDHNSETKKLLIDFIAHVTIQTKSFPPKYQIETINRYLDDLTTVEEVYLLLSFIKQREQYISIKDIFSIERHQEEEKNSEKKNITVKKLTHNEIDDFNGISNQENDENPNDSQNIEKLELEISKEMFVFQLEYLLSIYFKIPNGTFYISFNDADAPLDSFSNIPDLKENQYFVITRIISDSYNDMFQRLQENPSSIEESLPTYYYNQNYIPISLINSFNDEQIGPIAVQLCNLLPDDKVISVAIENIESFIKVYEEIQFKDAFDYLTSIYQKTIFKNRSIFTPEINVRFIKKIIQNDEKINAIDKAKYLYISVQFINQNYIQYADEIIPNVILKLSTSKSIPNLRSPYLEFLVSFMKKTNDINILLQNYSLFIELLESIPQVNSWKEWSCFLDIFQLIKDDTQKIKDIFTLIIDKCYSINGCIQRLTQIIKQLSSYITDMSFYETVVLNQKLRERLMNITTQNPDNGDEIAQQEASITSDNIEMICKVLTGILQERDISRFDYFIILFNLINDFLLSLESDQYHQVIFDFFTECLKYDNIKDLVHQIIQNLSQTQILSFNVSKPEYVSACGLSNIGNTCYMNAALQQLFYTFPLLYYLERTPDEQLTPEIVILKTLFLNMFKRAGKSLYTREFAESFSQSLGGMFPIGVQHDSGEFLRTLLDKLPNQCQRVLTGKTKTYYEDMDGNILSQTSEDFTTLNIILNNASSLEEGLQNLSQEHLLTGENRYRIDSGELVDARTYTKIDQLPSILAIQLARFDYNYQSGTRIKLDNVFSFPENLTINETPYSLKGVVIHSGYADFGHYYSHIKLNNQWMTFNDSTVSNTTFSNISSSAFGGSSTSAYILFYERNDISTIPGTSIPLKFSFNNRFSESQSDESIILKKINESIVLGTPMLNFMSKYNSDVSLLLKYFLDIAIKLSSNQEKIRSISNKILEITQSDPFTLLTEIVENFKMSIIQIFSNCSNENMFNIFTDFLTSILQNCGNSSLDFFRIMFQSLELFTDNCKRFFAFISKLTQQSDVIKETISQIPINQQIMTHFLSIGSQKKDISYALDLIMEFHRDDETDELLVYFRTNPEIMEIENNKKAVFNVLSKASLQIGVDEAKQVLVDMKQSDNVLEEFQKYLEKNSV